ncbi:MAG TPA: PilZ domain-containing protein [Acidimicrobiales bacterium]|jgi:hypothetical protein|nr:PilZ domain-containing protein [Acidimicrobiales bacterium]
MGHVRLERYRCDDLRGRRAFRRVPVRFALRCRRIGRRGFDSVVEAVDLSPGGVRFRARHGLDTGDVVLVTAALTDDDAIVFKGLVVQVVGLDHDSVSEVHVAFTGLSSAAQDDLARLLDLHDADGYAVSADPA